MDLNDYVMSQLVRARLADLRADAARHNAASDARSARPPLRVAVGLALIRLGRLAAGDAGRSLRPRAS